MLNELRLILNGERALTRTAARCRLQLISAFRSQEKSSSSDKVPRTLQNSSHQTMRTSSQSSSSSPTVIICPGNGCSQIRQSNWYGQLYDILTESHKIPCVCDDFPDPLHARRDIWVPHIRSLAEKSAEDSGDPQNVILVGHSSGAQAALRYAELYPVHGVVLVSATYSDLGDAHERASGYYPQPSKGKGEGGESNPYLFDNMKQNCKHWHQFHSDDDPFIPLHEAERVRDGLGLSDTYYMLPGRSHYFKYSPELLDVILSLC